MIGSTVNHKIFKNCEKSRNHPNSIIEEIKSLTKNSQNLGFSFKSLIFKKDNTYTKTSSRLLTERSEEIKKEEVRSYIPSKLSLSIPDLNYKEIKVNKVVKKYPKVNSLTYSINLNLNLNVNLKIKSTSNKPSLNTHRDKLKPHYLNNFNRLKSSIENVSSLNTKKEKTKSIKLPGKIDQTNLNFKFAKFLNIKN
jgi:hypothetical protein